MQGWTNFIKLLKSGRDKAPLWCWQGGILHIISIIILIGLVVGIVFLNKYKKINKISYKYILLGCFIVLVILEIFKQFTVMYDIDEGTGDLILDYGWNSFPFQLCSSPYYILPVVIFTPEGKIRKRFELFCSIYFLFGGLIGFITPTFVNLTYWLNYHTLIYHGFMIVLAILIGLQCKGEFNLTSLWQASLIYVGLLTIAILLNWIIPACCPDAINPETSNKLNLFFISWHCAPPVSPLKEIWNAVPYVAYFFIFLFGMVFATFLFYTLLSLIYNHKINFKFNNANQNNPKETNFRKQGI